MTVIELHDRARAAQEILDRKAARRGLLDFICYTKPDYETQPYHEVLCQYAEKWISGELPRQIWTLPPQHGKSEIASRRLPSYILGRYPDANILSVSYGGDLVRDFSRDVQNIITSPEYRVLFPGTRLADSASHADRTLKDARTIAEFTVVGNKGRYRGAGIGGGITGRGFHFIIVDDLIKNRKEAYSQTYRDYISYEFNNVILTRRNRFLDMPGRVLIPMTRWHDDDIAGRCIRNQTDAGWVVVNFPAIMTAPNPNGYDKRRPGEVLWPSHFPKSFLDEMRTALGHRDWAALYEGSPKVAEGNIFRREWWKYYTARPARFDMVVFSLDTAYEEKTEGSYSVCQVWGVQNKFCLLLDEWRARVEYPALIVKTKQMAATWQPHKILIEKAASGRSLEQSLRAETKLPVIGIDIQGKGKTLRAHASTALIEAGRVLLPDSASWLEDYLMEMDVFPSGKYDDRVDATTQLINWIQPRIYGGAYSRFAI